jgi:2-polyprenyl-6-hydroxyphenyl methylase/3-demethylubiquinone-9 3-methyltransferase
VKSHDCIQQEIATGRRFEFGKNWARFLATVDDARIQQAMLSIQRLLHGKDLAGKKFLDVGCGSGLMSLAARNLGLRVVSFDYDPTSVACTNELKEAYFADDPMWTVHQGSVLDKSFLASLGAFDFVYAWGVLHHTGDMWTALDNMAALVAEKGSVVVALYNDQGVWSKVWRIIKATYNKLPRYLKTFFVILIMPPLELKTIAVPLLKGKFGYISERWSGHTRSYERGMSRWYDMVDWVGGYPFEVSKPEQVFYEFKRRGFIMTELKTCAGELGCNEYVFEKT